MEKLSLFIESSSDISESIKITQNKNDYIIYFIIKEHSLSLNIYEKEELGSPYYTKEITLDEIKKLDKSFNDIKSCNEFLKYIKDLINNNKFIIKKENNKMSINIITKYLSKENIIEISLLNGKLNSEKIMKDVCKEVLLLKEKNQILEDSLKKKNNKYVSKNIIIYFLILNGIFFSYAFIKLNNKIKEVNKLIDESKVIKEQIEIQYIENLNLKEEIKEDIKILKEKLINQNNKITIIEERIKEINKIVLPIKKENKLNRIGNGFKKSTIIRYDEIDVIIESVESRLGKEIEDIKILYKSSIDGGEPINFHEKCDDIPNTLTLIKSNENKRFGGFTSVTWESSSEIIYKDDINAFLFSLDKLNIYPNKGLNCAICCVDSFGPIFGCFPSISITGNPMKSRKLCVNETNDLSSYDFLDDTNFLLDEGKDDCIYAEEYEVFQIKFS